MNSLPDLGETIPRSHSRFFFTICFSACRSFLSPVNEKMFLERMSNNLTRNWNGVDAETALSKG